jgi:hypothetical protein
MTSPTDVPPPADEADIATEQHKNSRPQPSRLNQALAWVGIVAGGLFIVAGIFFSGFFLSWSEQPSPRPMDCCSHMKPGEQMKPGAMMAPGAQMKPGEQMKPGGMMPGGMMGPTPQSPTTSPNAPRP